MAISRVEGEVWIFFNVFMASGAGLERQCPVSPFMSSRGQCSSRKGPVLCEVVGDRARQPARLAGACPLSQSVREGAGGGC